MTANEIMRNIRNIFKLSFKEAVIHEILRVNKVVSSTCPTWILIIAESQRLTELIQSIKNRMMKIWSFVLFQDTNMYQQWNWVKRDND